MVIPKKPQTSNLSMVLRLGPSKDGVKTNLMKKCSCSHYNGAGSGGECACGTSIGGGGSA